MFLCQCCHDIKCHGSTKTELSIEKYPYAAPCLFNTGTNRHSTGGIKFKIVLRINAKLLLYCTLSTKVLICLRCTWSYCMQTIQISLFQLGIGE